MKVGFENSLLRVGAPKPGDLVLAPQGGAMKFGLCVRADPNVSPLAPSILCFPVDDEQSNGAFKMERLQEDNAFIFESASLVPSADVGHMSLKCRSVTDIAFVQKAWAFQSDRTRNGKNCLNATDGTDIETSHSLTV